MEISKIAFEQFRKLGIDKDFEEFDVNVDNVINEQDAAAASNQALANEITNILNNVDEETELEFDADFDVSSLSKAGASSDNISAADKTDSMSKADYEKNIYKSTYMGLASDGKLRDEVENSKGTTFVLMYCNSVSVEHCGNGDWIRACENIKNDKNSILDAMYDLKDYANFKYVPSQAVPGLHNGQAKSSPTIAKFVDGKFVEAIYLEADQANAQAIKDIFMCHLGLSENDTASKNENTVSEEKSDTITNTITSSTILTNDISKSSSAMNAITQLEINKLNDEQEEIQKNIESKQQELESKQKKILEKQEELETLVKNAQNNNDNSKAAYITDLQAEIKVLAGEIEGLQADIQKLQSDYSTNQIKLTALNAQLETQQTSTVDSVAQLNALSIADSVAIADGVSEVSAIGGTSQSTQTNESPKVFEYFDKLDCKFNELFERFGNREDIRTYVLEHPDEFMDITGDGKVDVTDLAITYEYRPNNIRSTENQDYKNGINWFVGAIRQSINKEKGITGTTYDKDTNTYNFDDMENLLNLGLSNDTMNRFMPQMFSHMDKNKIVQSENWESKLKLVMRLATTGYTGYPGTKCEQLFEELRTLAAENTNKVNGAEATDCEGATDKVSEVSEVSEVNKVTKTTQTTQTTCTKGVKSMAEYTEMLDSKFDELYEKFCGNTNEIVQYIKNNMAEFMDISGDGRMDQIDFQIIENYRMGLGRGKYNISSEKGEKYFSGINQFAAEIRQVLYRTIGHPACDTNFYSFDDMENLIKLGGKNRVQSMVSRMNKTKIVQTENWEAKLVTISRFCGGSMGVGKIKQFQEIADYIKEHPENAQYASIAVVYQKLEKGYEQLQAAEKEYSESRRAAYNDYLTDTAGYKEYVSDLKKDYPYAPTPTKEEYATHMAYFGDGGFSYTSKNDYYAGNAQQFKNTDINGDGVFDANDIKTLCKDIDLDGDGNISCEEKNFISEVKSAMESELYRTMKQKSRYNATNIDDIISYFENVDHNSQLQNEICKNNMTIDEAAANAELKLGWSFGSVPDAWYKNGEFIYDRADLRNTSYTSAAYRYMDGTEVSTELSESLAGQDITVSEAKKLQSETITYGSVEYTFLHYVQSADLSKDELQSILNKINGSSINTQYKLAEVKKIVETKLSNME